MFESIRNRMEDRATQWWDKTLRDPKTLTGMGWTLRGMSAWKAGWDRWLELTWSSARLPSALDVERVYERLGELEDQLARLDGKIQQPVSADRLDAEQTS